MLFNFNIAIIAFLASAGLAASEATYDQRLRRLGRVIAARQSSCQSDFDCGGSEVCCSGLVSRICSFFVVSCSSDPSQAFGPGEGAGIGSCIDQSGCSGGGPTALIYDLAPDT
jgi:hypothetical protein